MVEKIALAPSEFKSVDGAVLKSWQNADELGFLPYYKAKNGEVKFGSTRWAGTQPVLANL